MGVVFLYAFCTAILGFFPSTNERCSSLAFAERSPSDSEEEDLDTPSRDTSSGGGDESEGFEDTFTRITHRLADISRAHSEPQAEDSEVPLDTDDEGVESVEVRASPHALGLKRRSDSLGKSWEQREVALRHQLELTREERGEAESQQASEQREAAALAEKLATSTEEAAHAHDLLRETRQMLAAKSKEVASTHEALTQYLGLADDLRVAAGQAAKQASKAKHEAEMAKRNAVGESRRARQDVAAAEAVISEQDEAADEVSRERHKLRMHEEHAKAAQRKADAARKAYEEKFEKAQEAQIYAEQQRKLSLVKEQQLARQEFAAVQRERWKAAKALEAVKRADAQRQEHFKAAVSMREETEEAQVLVEQAGREKAAAQREKAQAKWVKQQAYRDRQTASTLSFFSWSLLALILIGVLGFSTEVYKLEAASLRPAKLLARLRGKHVATETLSPEPTQQVPQ